MPDRAGIGAGGHGERRLPIKVRCDVCGDIGRLQIRPPVTSHSPGGCKVAEKQNGPRGAALLDVVAGA